jgi:hypothetical protein
MRSPKRSPPAKPGPRRCIGWRAGSARTGCESRNGCTQIPTRYILEGARGFRCIHDIEFPKRARVRKTRGELDVAHASKSPGHRSVPGPWGVRNRACDPSRRSSADCAEDAKPADETKPPARVKPAGKRGSPAESGARRQGEGRRRNEAGRQSEALDETKPSTKRSPPARTSPPAKPGPPATSLAAQFTVVVCLRYRVDSEQSGLRHDQTEPGNVDRDSCAAG